MIQPKNGGVVKVAFGNGSMSGGTVGKKGFSWLAPISISTPGITTVASMTCLARVGVKLGVWVGVLVKVEVGLGLGVEVGTGVHVGVGLASVVRVGFGVDLGSAFPQAAVTITKQMNPRIRP